MDGGTRAAQALVDSGIEHTITRHGMVRSLEEAAADRGVEPRDIIKTLVVRRGEGDHLFVLVPGDRQISWPKLRALLSVNRISLPDKEIAMGDESNWNKTASELRAPDATPDEHLPPGVARVKALNALARNPAHAEKIDAFLLQLAEAERRAA